jgi:hypothetical protein
MPALTKDQIDRVIELYRSMPGAVMPATENGVPMWGDVDRTEHWQFCERIVLMTDEAVGRAVGSLCMAHNLV